LVLAYCITHKKPELKKSQPQKETFDKNVTHSPHPLQMHRASGARGEGDYHHES